MKKFLSPLVRRIIARLIDGPLTYKALKSELSRPDQIEYNPALHSMLNQKIITMTPIDASACENPTIDLPYREAWLAILASTVPDESHIISSAKGMSCVVATLGAISVAGHPVTLDEVAETFGVWGLPYPKEQIMDCITHIRKDLDGKLISEKVVGTRVKSYFVADSATVSPTDNRIEDVPEMHFSELREYIAKWKEDNPGRKIYFSAKDMRWHSEVIA